MPYLSPRVLHDTVLTPAESETLRTHLAVQAELYRRHYPMIEWYTLKFTPTVSVDDAANNSIVSGDRTDGGTVLHDVYGEAIAQPELPTSPIGQPHGNRTDAMAVDADSRKQYEAARYIHGHLKFEEPDDSAEAVGKKGKRDVILSLSTVLLDEQGITVREGDRFSYRGLVYDIQQANVPEEACWLKYTNIPLFIRCHASLRRTGS